VSDTCLLVKEDDTSLDETANADAEGILTTTTLSSITNTTVAASTPKCEGTEPIIVTSELLTEPEIFEGEEEDLEENDALLPGEVPADRADPKVLQQTKRLFRFVMGLKEDDDENELEDDLSIVGIHQDAPISSKQSNKKKRSIASEEDNGIPPLRLIKLLEMSFRILGKHCDSRYVQNDFKKDVKRAILFLFKESLTTVTVEDVSQDEYDKIMLSLESCWIHDTPFELEGMRCRTFSNVK
jgi:hypothetical protein